MLVVDHGLDDDEVLGGDEPHLLPLEVAERGAFEHLLVQEDAARRLEDDVDEHVVLEGLEQPVRIGLLGGEPGVLQYIQHLAGVLGAHEEVDVMRPTGSAHGSRAHAAHQHVVDTGGVKIRSFD